MNPLLNETNKSMVMATRSISKFKNEAQMDLYNVHRNFALIEQTIRLSSSKFLRNVLHNNGFRSGQPSVWWYARPDRSWYRTDRVEYRVSPKTLVGSGQCSETWDRSKLLSFGFLNIWDRLDPKTVSVTRSGIFIFLVFISRTAVTCRDRTKGLGYMGWPSFPSYPH